MGIEGNSRIAVVLMAIIIISSIGLVLLLNTGPQTLEWRYGDDDARREHDVIKITGIEDTDISITFVDEPDLVARVTYELHSDNTAPLYIDDDTIGVVEISGGSGNDRVKTLEIVLGIESAYNILIRGANLTASVTYSNNANVFNAVITFESPDSDIEFIVTEDISFGGEFQAFITASDVEIDVNLPDGLNGVFRYTSPSVDILSLIGWSSEPGARYETETGSTSFPFLDLSVGADSIRASLST